ncbi:MAG: hypothetical protein ABL962_19760 [Fimbriimonadaceae bacterium]
MIYTTLNTTIHTWFERDRQHVELRRATDSKTIAEWWDEDVTQAVEDGFLNPKNYHRSAVEYANDMGFDLWMAKKELVNA